jgi:beta-glucosidase
MNRFFFISFLLSFNIFTSNGQAYKDSRLSTEVRVQDLLSRMTPEEKFWQLFMIPGDLGNDPEKYKTGIFGFQVSTVGNTADIAQQMMNYHPGANAFETAVKINEIQRFFIENSRLGIPIIPFDEALHGLVRAGATAFPQAIALASTWNTELMHSVATAIAMESKTRGIRQILSPVVNLANDVRWGRTEETYGEDPFLASEMGVAFISAFEQLDIITTPKHFVANVGDGGRDSYPIHFNERFMRETHLPPFEAAIRRGGARSIMTAYNSYDGTPSTANNWLLNEVLKDEWGFKGFVISDAGGTGGANVLHMTAADYPDATAKSLVGGLDVIFQTAYDHHTLFSPPFYDGTIPTAVIDSAVARVLRLKFELGLFENPYVDPEQARYYNGHTDHRNLALESALQSVVLLKNNNTLPLSKGLKSVAVIGPDASAARLGGYSGPGINKVSILDGIKNLVGPNVQINYAYGCDHEKVEFVTVPAEALSATVRGTKQTGLQGKYYNNVTWSGRPSFKRIDRNINFRWTLFSPDPDKLTYDFYSVRWKGKIKSPETGTFKIGIDGNDGYRLFLDGKLLIDNFIKSSRRVTLADFTFEKEREYDIVIEYYEPVGNAWFSLVWNVGLKDNNHDMDEAVRLAAASDVAIIAVGIEEGEFLDRALLGLPGRQEELIKRVAATGIPVVVLLVGGSPVTMTSWMDDVPAIVAVWYPGEEGGNAVAKILFGDHNPAGRLPVTWPVHEGQLPLVYNHKPTGRGDDYINLTGQPLFPFGFGLSYTSFKYSDIKIGKSRMKPGESTWVSVKVKNTGKIAGDEVVQLYIRDELSSVARPVMELKGFSRIHLKPRESKEIRFIIDPEILSMLNQNMETVVEPGQFRIMIGASSKDIRQRIFLEITEP